MNTNPQAKRILIYGDSYTYGWLTGYGRFAADERFTGVMQKELGNNFEVIEEGLRGRMLCGENIFFPHRNGLLQFAGIAGSHLAVDMIAFFLGTNDCNAGGSVEETTIRKALDEYKALLDFWAGFMNTETPKICLICPPFVNEELLHPLFKEIFTGAEGKSKLLPAIYKSYANNNGWHYFDSNTFVKAGAADGIHIDKESHKLLGEKLAEYVLQII